MVGHIALERIHGRYVYLIRIYNNMKDLVDPTKRAEDGWECAEVVCSKEALEAYNEVGSEEEYSQAFSDEQWDLMVKNINIQTERINNG